MKKIVQAECVKWAGGRSEWSQLTGCNISSHGDESKGSSEQSAWDMYMCVAFVRLSQLERC